MAVDLIITRYSIVSTFTCYVSLDLTKRTHNVTSPAYHSEHLRLVGILRTQCRCLVLVGVVLQFSKTYHGRKTKVAGTELTKEKDT